MSRQQRAERERVKAYQARRAYHDARISRRRRDNVIAAIAGGLLVIAVAGGQFAYYAVGPGAPAEDASTPAPSPVTTEPTVDPEPTPAPTS